ncbi:MAG: hypothetical protein KBD66_04440 [Candidatus Doudnabacteria bacterium]|nr:hypothetical protein [Candidatus Doudnabacteria bacterium]
MTEWFKELSRLSKLGLTIAALLIFGLIGWGFFYALFVDFVDNYELGYKYDARSGKVERIGRTGYVITWPFVVKVHKVDLRPMQVCNNANSRVLNCKLVQFNGDGLELFLSWHGRNDYSGDSNLSDILRSYAYDGSGKAYSFLKVIRELKPEEAIAGAAVVTVMPVTNPSTAPEVRK